MSWTMADRTVTIDTGEPSPITGLWRVLSRHVLMFVLVAACVLALGGGIVTSLPKTYTTAAIVVVAPQEADPMQTGQAAGTAQDNDVRTATEVSMLTSRDVAAVVVRTLGIGQAPRAPSHLWRLLCRALDVGCARAVPVVPTLDQRIDDFLLRRTVVQEPRSSVIDVTVADRDPELAAKAANGLVTAEQSYALSREAGDLDRTVGWLDQRTTELRNKWLVTVELANTYRLMHHLNTAGISAAGATQGLSEEEVQQGSISLLDAQARLAAAQAQEGALRSAPGGNAAAAADPEVAALTGQLATVEAARAQAAGQLGANHPELRALDQQVASARASLRVAVGRALGAVTGRANAARAEVAQLRSGLQGLKGTAGQEAGLLAHYETLEQEAASARTVYETFLTRQKELAGRTTILRPPVEFVSHAPVPDRPSAPKRSQLLAGVVALALGVASAAVFLREHLAAGFSDIARLRTSLRLPLLSVVPRVSGRRDAVRRHVLDEPYGRTSEAMRSVMAQIALAAGDGETTQTVLISSADAREGKTTIALWLAILAADGGPGVLLIDGDHRRGLVSSQLGSAGQMPGLTEFLAGAASLDQVLQIDVATGVRFIAAGRPSARPLGQAEIGRLERLLARLRGEFRLIVIDSPPLMGMSDALIYARLASQTVFVCRWRETSRMAVITAIERLRDAGARLSGVVLSMVDPRTSVSYGADYGPRDVRGVRRLYGR